MVMVGMRGEAKGHLLREHREERQQLTAAERVPCAQHRVPSAVYHCHCHSGSDLLLL